MSQTEPDSIIAIARGVTYFAKRLEALAVSPAKAEAKPEAACNHPPESITYTPDPSGNNDTSYRCACGRELTPKERAAYHASRAKPEAGTVPPEGMPEALREKWTPDSRVYKSGDGSLFLLYPRAWACGLKGNVRPTNTTEGEAQGTFRGTLLPNRPAPTPSPAGEADSIEAVAKDLAELVDAGRNAGFACNDFLMPFYHRLRRLQPTREMPGSVRALIRHVILDRSQNDVADKLCADAEADFTPAPAPDAVPVVRTETDRQRMADRVRDELMTRVLRRLDALEAKGTK